MQEPDLGKDLVTLNMVKDIEIRGNDVSFTVVLTTPACPMKDMISNACVNAIKILVNKEAIVKVNFTSNTTTKRTDPGTVLPNVKNIIAVVSGKGVWVNEPLPQILHLLYHKAVQKWIDGC